MGLSLIGMRHPLDGHWGLYCRPSVPMQRVQPAGCQRSLPGRSSSDSGAVHRLWTPPTAPSAVGWLVGRRIPAPAQVPHPCALQGSYSMPCWFTRTACSRQHRSTHSISPDSCSSPCFSPCPAPGGLCPVTDASPCRDAGDSGPPPQKCSSQDPATPSNRDPDLWGELEDASAPPRWRQVRRRTAVRSAHPVPETRRDAASPAHPQCTHSPPLPPLPSREHWISRSAPLAALPCQECMLVRAHLRLSQTRGRLHGAGW